jgi:hypothetical protein
MNVKYKVLIHNIGDDPVLLPEVGVTVQTDDYVDIMDESNPGGYYSRVEEALRAINELTGTVLYQGVHGAHPFLEYEVVVEKQL